MKLKRSRFRRAAERGNGDFGIAEAADEKGPTSVVHPAEGKERLDDARLRELVHHEGSRRDLGPIPEHLAAATNWAGFGSSSGKGHVGSGGKPNLRAGEVHLQRRDFDVRGVELRRRVLARPGEQHGVLRRREACRQIGDRTRCAAAVGKIAVALLEQGDGQAAQRDVSDAARVELPDAKLVISGLIDLGIDDAGTGEEFAGVKLGETTAGGARVTRRRRPSG